MSAKKPQCCKNCAHWDRAYAEDKAGRLSKHATAICAAPIPDFSLIPDSVRINYAALNRTRLTTGWMSAFDGKTCPTFTPATQQERR